MKQREKILLIALILAVTVYPAFEIGRSKGYGEGKETILEFLSKYECMGHMPLPGGSIECTRWARRTQPD